MLSLETPFWEAICELALMNGFVPSSADTILILDAGLNLFNAFANVANGQRLTTSDGLGSFVVNYGAGSLFDDNEIVLSNFFAAAIPGDYNQNGTVDAADYTSGAITLGQTFTLTNENPAAATPGVVDAEDYAFWSPRRAATSDALRTRKKETADTPSATRAG